MKSLVLTFSDWIKYCFRPDYLSDRIARFLLLNRCYLFFDLWMRGLLKIQFVYMFGCKKEINYENSIAMLQMQEMLCFKYAFLCELRLEEEKLVVSYYIKKVRFEHNGYELDKLFKVHPYKGLNIFQRIYIRLVEFLGAMELPYFKLISLFL